MPLSRSDGAPVNIFGAAGPLIAPTLIFAGDSEWADGWQGSGDGTTYVGRTLYWILQKMRRRYICDLNEHLFATDGYTTSQWISTYLASCVAACQAAVAAGSVPVVLIKLGTNNVASGGSSPPSFATIQADFETIFNALYAAGAVSCPILILPRASPSALSTNGEILRNGVNGYLAAQRWSKRRIIPIDTIKVMTNGDGTPLSGYLVDGLHPTPLGGSVEQGPIVSVLTALSPLDVIPDFITTTDAYNATYGLYGNRIVNGSLTGTTGTKSNSQATGSPPTSWAAGAFTTASFGHAGGSAGTHITGAFSSVTSSLDVPNEPMTQISLGGTASSEFIGIQQTVNGNLSAGDVVQFGMDIEWDSGLTNVSTIGAYLDFWYQGSLQEGLSLDGVSPWPGTSAGRMQIISNQLTVPSGYGNQNIVVSLFAQGSTNGPPSGNVRFGQAWVRKTN